MIGAKKTAKRYTIMCLIAFAWRAHPQFELILAANRDEFHGRPADAANWWQDMPDILAGKDLQAGGSWLAVSRSGRFATVTNYREQSFTHTDYKSRGDLVTNFVSGSESPKLFSNNIDAEDYAGFNLLSGDSKSISYISNRGDSEDELASGVYGLSNAALDTPWTKLTKSKESLTDLIDADRISAQSLLELMGDRNTAAEDVNSEHLPQEMASALTAPFIVTPDYGTRCTTVLLRREDGHTEFTERRFDANGSENGFSQFEF